MQDKTQRVIKIFLLTTPLPGVDKPQPSPIPAVENFFTATTSRTDLQYTSVQTVLKFVKSITFLVHDL